MVIKTCALCIGDLGLSYTMEPLGKGDALVAVCFRCSTEEVIPKEIVRTSSFRERTTLDSRQTRIREHRDNLERQGLCRNGAKHGPALKGRKVCAACVSSRSRKGDHDAADESRQ